MLERQRIYPFKVIICFFYNDAAPHNDYQKFPVTLIIHSTIELQFVLIIAYWFTCHVVWDIPYGEKYRLMYPSGELFMRSREGYFGFYLKSWEYNTRVSA